MRHPMRSLAVLPVLILGLLPVSQSETVNIPFAFEAKGAAFPAGQYEVSMSPNHGFLSLQSKQFPAKQFTWVAHPNEASPQGGAVLSFDNVGSGAVLKSIQNLQWRTNDFSGSRAKASAAGEEKGQGNE